MLPQRHGDRAGPCTSSRISAAGRSGRRAPRARLPACLRGEGICVVNYVARRRRFLARLCGKRRGWRMCRVRMLLEHVSCRRALMADGSCGQVTVLALPRHVTYVLASRHLTAQSGEGIWSGISVRVARHVVARARIANLKNKECLESTVSFFTTDGQYADAPNGPRQTRRDGASSALVPSQNGFSSPKPHQLNHTARSNLVHVPGKLPLGYYGIR